MLITARLGAVACEWGTTSVYYGIIYTFCHCRWVQVPDSIFLFMPKISFEGHKQTLQKIPCRFKTWMGFVGQILIKLKTSLIRGFLQLPFDALLGVTCANMLLATQWPLKRTPHVPGFVWYWGLEAHWNYLRYPLLPIFSFTYCITFEHLCWNPKHFTNTF